MYCIQYSKQASATLRKMPKNMRLRISSKLQDLAKSPLSAANAKKLSGDEGVYRLRIASWRIVYFIEEEKMIIHIQKVDTRGGIYKK